MLNEDIGNDIVPDKEIREALIDAIHKNEIINNNGHIYHPYMFKCEVELAHKLFHSVPVTSIVVLVGDADQLPSVGTEKVNSNIIREQFNCSCIFNIRL